MQYFPSLKDYQQLNEASRICFSVEISFNTDKIIDLFATLSKNYPDATLFEVAETGCTYIALESRAQLRAEKGLIHKTSDNLTKLYHEQPLTQLKELTTELTCYITPNHQPFISSCLGFLSYDAARYFEELPDRHTHSDIPEVLFNFYRINLCFQQQAQTLIIGLIDEHKIKTDESYQKSTEQLAQLVALIQDSPTFQPEKASTSFLPTVNTDISDTQFMQMVEQAKISIHAGEAFQIVLSRKFFLPYTVSPLSLFSQLKKTSPAPYLFYLPYKNNIIIGASPERLITVNQHKISINPIAGTRKKQSDSDLNQIEQDLLHDPKEVAEHMMLVDLARNDIGAVCKAGTVKVTELMKIKHFSHISHITSLVCGELDSHQDSYLALAKAFPAGTLSGAPKIRAMEIIDALETSRRDLYGGAICRFDYQHNLDSCIAIRMAVLNNGLATIRTGAGIVYDSIPLHEAQETKNKAHNLLDTICKAHESTRPEVIS